MTKRPEFALKVSNLDAGIDFFVNRIGFTLQERQPDRDVADVRDLDGDLILLAGPKVENVKEHLAGAAFVILPGEAIRFAEDNLEARRATLLERGLSDLRFEETVSGDRVLSVQGPDDYTVAFVARAQRSQDDVLRMYAQGPKDLQAVLEGLSEVDYDLARSPGQWSIRQIVHHLAEGEMLFAPMIKAALAQPGSVYIRNQYNQETWPEIFKYATRPVDSSVALVTAIRAHLVELLQRVPDNWEQYAMMRTIDGDPEGRKVTVGGLVGGMAQHMEEHCEEIRTIRKLHGR